MVGRASGRAQIQIKPADGRRIWIGGARANARTVRAHFEQFGELESLDVFADQNIAFVVFVDPKSAQNSTEKENISLDGRGCTVQMSSDKGYLQACRKREERDRRVGGQHVVGGNAIIGGGIVGGNSGGRRRRFSRRDQGSRGRDSNNNNNNAPANAEDQAANQIVPIGIGPGAASAGAALASNGGRERRRRRRRGRIGRSRSCSGSGRRRRRRRSPCSSARSRSRSRTRSRSYSRSRSHRSGSRSRSTAGSRDGSRRKSRRRSRSGTRSCSSSRSRSPRRRNPSHSGNRVGETAEDESKAAEKQTDGRSAEQQFNPELPAVVFQPLPKLELSKTDQAPAPQQPSPQQSGFHGVSEPTGRESSSERSEQPRVRGRRAAAAAAVLAATNRAGSVDAQERSSPEHDEGSADEEQPADWRDGQSPKPAKPRQVDKTESVPAGADTMAGPIEPSAAAPESSEQAPPVAPAKSASPGTTAESTHIQKEAESNVASSVPAQTVETKQSDSKPKANPVARDINAIAPGPQQLPATLAVKCEADVIEIPTPQLAPGAAPKASARDRGGAKPEVAPPRATKAEVPISTVNGIAPSFGHSLKLGAKAKPAIAPTFINGTGNDAHPPVCPQPVATASRATPAPVVGAPVVGAPVVGATSSSGSAAGTAPTGTIDLTRSNQVALVPRPGPQPTDLNAGGALTASTLDWNPGPDLIKVALNFRGKRKLVRHLSNTLAGEVLRLSKLTKKPRVLVDFDGFQVGPEVPLGTLARNGDGEENLLELTVEADDWGDDDSSE